MTKKRDCDSLPDQPYLDHIRGLGRGKVQLLEYGDYQCPRCVEAHQILLAILAEFGEQVQFIFRHFPLTDINSQAYKAAEAAEAAGSQGKFWEMHDRLFMSPQMLDDASLVEHAIALRLNINQFLKEIASNHHAERIATHISQGKKDGVHLPPTLFINQQRFRGNWSGMELFRAVRESLQQIKKNPEPQRNSVSK